MFSCGNDVTFQINNMRYMYLETTAIEQFYLYVFLRN